MNSNWIDATTMLIAYPAQGISIKSVRIEQIQHDAEWLIVYATNEAENAWFNVDNNYHVRAINATGLIKPNDWLESDEDKSSTFPSLSLHIKFTVWHIQIKRQTNKETRQLLNISMQFTPKRIDIEQKAKEQRWKTPVKLHVIDHRWSNFQLS